MEYEDGIEMSAPRVNEPGFGHLAFEVPYIDKTIEILLPLGGALQGQVTNFGTEEEPCLIVYVRDPEGNLLELEQPRAASART